MMITIIENNRSTTINVTHHNFVRLENGHFLGQQTFAEGYNVRRRWKC